MHYEETAPNTLLTVSAIEHEEPDPGFFEGKIALTTTGKRCIAMVQLNLP